MTGFKVLLLFVMVLSSITHIHLAWLLYTWQSNNKHFLARPRGAVYDTVYLNKMYMAELESILTNTLQGCVKENIKPNVFPFSLF